MNYGFRYRIDLVFYSRNSDGCLLNWNCCCLEIDLEDSFRGKIPENDER